MSLNSVRLLSIIDIVMVIVVIGAVTARLHVHMYGPMCKYMMYACI